MERRASRRGACWLPVILVWCLLPPTHVVATAPQEPLLTAEQQQALIARVRENLWRDRELEPQYTYLEKRRDVRVSKLGKVTVGDERTFEVYPSRERGRTYRRLIAVNGVPLPEADLKKRDEKHLNDMLGEERRRQSETPAQRAARERKDAERRARQRQELDDVFAVYEFRAVARESLEGHDRPLLRLTMTPRRQANPKSDAGKYLKKLSGTAWVDELDGEVVRVELKAIEDLTVGWGLIGRVHEGSVASYERRKVNGEVWLPWRAKLDLRGRAALLRPFEVHTETTWWDYRKFSVDTAVIGVSLPK